MLAPKSRLMSSLASSDSPDVWLWTARHRTSSAFQVRGDGWKLVSSIGSFNHLADSWPRALSPQRGELACATCRSRGGPSLGLPQRRSLKPRRVRLLRCTTAPPSPELLDAAWRIPLQHVEQMDVLLLFRQGYAAQRGRSHGDLAQHASAVGLEAEILDQAWSTLSGAPPAAPDSHSSSGRGCCVCVLRMG